MCIWRIGDHGSWTAYLLDGEGRGRAAGVAAHPLEHRQVPQPLSLRSLRRCGIRSNSHKLNHRPIDETRLLIA